MFSSSRISVLSTLRIPLAITWFSTVLAMFSATSSFRSVCCTSVSISSLRSHGSVLPRDTDSTISMLASVRSTGLPVSDARCALRTRMRSRASWRCLRNRLYAATIGAYPCSASTISIRSCMSSMCGIRRPSGSSDT